MTRSFLTILRRFFIEPPSVIVQPELRRRLRLLTSMLTVMMTLAFLILASLPVQLRFVTDPYMRHYIGVTFPPILSAVLVSMAVPYVLSRLGRYKASALIYVAIVQIFLFFNVIESRDVYQLKFLMIGVVLSSILFPRREALAVFALVVLGTSVFFFAMPGFPPEEIIQVLLLIAMIGTLGLVSTSIRDRDLEQISVQTRELLENQEKLVDAKKMESIARLSAGIAHQFNNIVTAIVTYSEVIAAKPAESAGRYSLLIKEAGMRASRLTGQLLSFSRQQLLRPKVTNLNLLVESIQGVLKSMIGEGTGLTMRLDPEPTIAYVDPDLIVEAIRKLVAKAGDNVRAGGRIVIGTKASAAPQHGHPGASSRQDYYCAVRIDDNGPLIDKEVLARIFDPYFTDGEFGTGDLDLASAYGIISQSDGHIEVATDAERGNSFIVFLPKKEASRP